MPSILIAGLSLALGGSLSTTPATINGHPIAITDVGAHFGAPGISMDAFAVQVAEALDAYSRSHHKEACGAIAASPDGRFGIVLGTSGGAITCVVDHLRVPLGMTSTGKSIHSHPREARLRPTKSDIKVGGLVGMPTFRKTVVNDGAHGFSEQDFKRPGYVVASNTILYQAGRRQVREVGQLGLPNGPVLAAGADRTPAPAQPPVPQVAIADAPTPLPPALRIPDPVIAAPALAAPMLAVAARPIITQGHLRAPAWRAPEYLLPSSPLQVAVRPVATLQVAEPTVIARIEAPILAAAPEPSYIAVEHEQPLVPRHVPAQPPAARQVAVAQTRPPVALPGPRIIRREAATVAPTYASVAAAEPSYVAIATAAPEPSLPTYAMAPAPETSHVAIVQPRPAQRAQPVRERPKKKRKGELEGPTIWKSSLVYIDADGNEIANPNE